MSQLGAAQPRATSPTVLVTNCDENEKQTPKIGADDKCLAPNRNLNESFSESDRYYTASSGEEYDHFDNSDDSHDDDDDDEGLCIRLDSDEDEHDLSGLHINLKTLQAVSSMLAHYNPIIQSDSFGNPLFIAPPPPEEDYENEDVENDVIKKRISQKTPDGSNRASVTSPKKQSSIGDDPDDYEDVLQQLDDVIISQDKSLLSDAMTELTNVMEKMTRFSEENNEDK